MYRALVIGLGCVVWAGVASADVRGSYKRVGGWSYVENDDVMSCGGETRKTLSQLFQRARTFTIGRSQISVNGEDKGYVIISHRERNKVVGRQEHSDSVWNITIAELDNGDLKVLWGRVAKTSSGSCADFWQASLDRDE